MAYQVFISHAYDHRAIYYDLVAKLSTADRFGPDFRNKSLQFDMRFEDQTEEQKAAVRRDVAARIESCDVLIALTKPVAGKRDFIQWEINLAKELGIPIIGVTRQPTDFVSKFVRERADVMVPWRVDSIVGAIREQAKRARRKRKLDNKEIEAVAAVPLPEALPDTNEMIDAKLIEAANSISPQLVRTELPRDVLYKDEPAMRTPIPPGGPRWRLWPFRFGRDRHG